MAKNPKTSPVLEATLDFLSPYLKLKGLNEICINRPGEVWLENQEGKWSRKVDEKITRVRMNALFNLLANESAQYYSEDYPIISAAIPGYGFRIQGVSGNLAPEGGGLSIRLGERKVFPLEDYFGDKSKVVRDFIAEGVCILVAGGTSTGKTSCLNSIVREIPKDLRLIVQENMRELIIDPTRNVFYLEAGESRKDNDPYIPLLNSIVRLRPDRIVFGELTPRSTEPFLRIANTGHRGCMTTVHAESPTGALEALKRNLLLSNAADSGLLEYVYGTVDLVVQLKLGYEERKGKRRKRVSADIWEVPRKKEI